MIFIEKPHAAGIDYRPQAAVVESEPCSSRESWRRTWGAGRAPGGGGDWGGGLSYDADYLLGLLSWLSLPWLGAKRSATTWRHAPRQVMNTNAWRGWRAPIPAPVLISAILCWHISKSSERPCPGGVHRLKLGVCTSLCVFVRALGHVWHKWKSTLTTAKLCESGVCWHDSYIVPGCFCNSVWIEPISIAVSTCYRRTARNDLCSTIWTKTVILMNTFVPVTPIYILVVTFALLKIGNTFTCDLSM